MRPLYEIAREIRWYWPTMPYRAEIYLDAMDSLNDISDHYFCDPGDLIIRYFLSNANTWRGEDARRLKCELREMLKGAR